MLEVQDGITFILYIAKTVKDHTIWVIRLFGFHHDCIKTLQLHNAVFSQTCIFLI